MNNNAVDQRFSPDSAMGNQPPCKNLFRVADRKETSMRPKMIKKARAVKMLCFQMTRMPMVISIVVINITNVTATPAAPALGTLSYRFLEAVAEAYDGSLCQIHASSTATGGG